MKQERINIIIVTVYFPPILSVASNRMLAFAKYLDKDRFNVSVVTISYDDKNRFEHKDGFLVYYMPNLQIIRMATFKKKSPYVVHKMKAAWNKVLVKTGSQEYKAWMKSAIQKVEELIKSDSENIILSSYPTEEPLNVCMKIKKKHPEVKWVADLRDAISNNPYLNESQRKKNLELEKQVIETADLVLTVSEPIKIDLLNKSAKVKCIELRNGFDFDSPDENYFGEQFTMTYAGTFYAERNPGRFFKVVIDLIESKRISVPVINFIGVSGGIIIPRQLKNIVNCVERIEYEKIVPFLFKSDALLLIQPGSEYKGLFSGKIFDYLGALRPIIALVDKNDVAAKLIEDCNAGFVASFDRDNEIEEAILKAHELWKNKQCLNFNKEIIAQHHRSVQVKDLGEHLITLVS